MEVWRGGVWSREGDWELLEVEGWDESWEMFCEEEM